MSLTENSPRSKTTAEILLYPRNAASCFADRQVQTIAIHNSGNNLYLIVATSLTQSNISSCNKYICDVFVIGWITEA